MSELITLIYGSCAVEPFSDNQLIALLEQSRRKNKRLNITGMLLYWDCNFLQVLEGDASAVEPLYDEILHDPRHHDVQLFLKRPILAREFGNWSMGFANLSGGDMSRLAGFTSYLNEPPTAEHFDDQSYASIFLDVFKQAMR